MKKLIILLILLFPVFGWAGGVCMMGGGVDSGGSPPATKIEYIVPDVGIINDTELGYEVIIPGGGIYNQQ